MRTKPIALDGAERKNSQEPNGEARANKAKRKSSREQSSLMTHDPTHNSNAKFVFKSKAIMNLKQL